MAGVDADDGSHAEQAGKNGENIMLTPTSTGLAGHSANASDPDFAGYKVVANDGEIGHLRSFATAPDAGHLIVDTGGWVLVRLSVIPAIAVRVVDHESKTVQVNLTMQQIKDAPEYHPDAGSQ